MRFTYGWLALGVAAALCTSSVQAAEVNTTLGSAGDARLTLDDGQMESRRALNTSGATVMFSTAEPKDLVSVQFYGARYATNASPSEIFTLSIADGDFNPIRRIDKPLFNISPGREVWQTLAVDPAVRVNGRFYVTLAHASDPDKGIYIGVDETAPSGHSYVGLPGTVPTAVEEPLNWMIRPVLVEPGSSRPAPAIQPRVSVTEERPGAPASPQFSTPTPAPGTSRPGTGAAVVNPTPMAPVIASGSPGGGMAYRDPHRRLSFPSTPPPIPNGSGRVDATWNVQPVTIELNYVGKPPKILENMDVTRLVVDFPVPEPGLFNVVIRKPGYQSVSRQFRVVSGSRQEWRAQLVPVDSAPGAPVPSPMDEPTDVNVNMPVPEDPQVEITDDGQPDPRVQPIDPRIIDPANPAPIVGPAPPPRLNLPPGAEGPEVAPDQQPVTGPAPGPGQAPQNNERPRTRPQGQVNPPGAPPVPGTPPADRTITGPDQPNQPNPPGVQPSPGTDEGNSSDPGDGPRRRPSDDPLRDERERSEHMNMR